MAINKKVTIDFSAKRVKEVKEFILLEAVKGTVTYLPSEVMDIVKKNGKTYYKCKNPKFKDIV